MRGCVSVINFLGKFFTGPGRNVAADSYYIYIYISNVSFT